MTARRAGAALCAALVLAGAACDSGDGGRTAAPPSTVASTTSTTVAPTTTTSTTTPFPRPPREPAALAADVTVVERGLRDPATPPAEVKRLAWMQQANARVLAADSDLRRRTMAMVDPPLRARVDAHTDAQADLFALTKPAPAGKLPDWRIVPPPPQEELLAHYQEAGAAIGVPWQYLAAIHLVETRMGRIRGVSSAGAQGPMQFLPSTWTQYGAGGDIEDPRDAIHAAARLLRRNGAPDDMANALFNYNRSQRYVRAVTTYAEAIRADETIYRSYWHWQVYYRTEGGDLLLPEGWPEVPAATV